MVKNKRRIGDSLGLLLLYFLDDWCCCSDAWSRDLASRWKSSPMNGAMVVDIRLPPSSCNISSLEKTKNDSLIRILTGSWRSDLEAILIVSAVGIVFEADVVGDLPRLARVAFNTDCMWAWRAWSEASGSAMAVPAIGVPATRSPQEPAEEGIRSNKS